MWNVIIFVSTARNRKKNEWLLVRLQVTTQGRLFSHCQFIVCASKAPSVYGKHIHSTPDITWRRPRDGHIELRVVYIKVYCMEQHSGIRFNMGAYRRPWRIAGMDTARHSVKRTWYTKCPLTRHSATSHVTQYIRVCSPILQSYANFKWNHELILRSLVPDPFKWVFTS